MTRLTKNRLIAIIEALNFRLADDIGDEGCSLKDYNGALNWAEDELVRHMRLKKGK